MRTSRVFFEDFRGHYKVPLAASNVGTRWSKADTSSAGSPTIQGVNEGGIKLLFDNTSEVQNLCLYMGDVLPFKITDLVRAEFLVSCPATLDPATSLAFGLASARNDAIDSIAAHASIRCIGDNNVVVETDDGTNDKDDIATGLTLGATPKRFVIDFATGIFTKDPPSLSVGRTADVQFFGGNSNRSLRRVASGTRFDMSNYTSGLQVYAQLQKTADTNEDWLILHEVLVEYSVPNA